MVSIIQFGISQNTKYVIWNIFANPVILCDESTGIYRVILTVLRWLVVFCLDDDSNMHLVIAVISRSINTVQYFCNLSTLAK